MEDERMMQTVWHFWCRALKYSWVGVGLAYWVFCVFVSVVFGPLMIFFQAPDHPETLLGKINLGMFCVGLSFLMLALWSMHFGMWRDYMKPEKCMSNVIAAIAEKIASVTATIGFHIWAVAGLVFVVRTVMKAWERV
jgi:hypothetical protein